MGSGFFCLMVLPGPSLLSPCASLSRRVKTEGGEDSQRSGRTGSAHLLSATIQSAANLYIAREAGKCDLALFL